MNLNKLLIGLVLVFIVALTANTVKAQTNATVDFEVTSIQIDGDDVFEEDMTSVERGSTVEIRVKLLALADSNNVRVEAEIKGLETDDVDTKTDYFDIKEGVTYTKTLKLKIPADLDEDDIEKDLTLVVEVSDNDETAFFGTGLRISSLRHDLNIQDVIFRAGNTVEAGSSVYVSVWVENKGSRTEEDVNVKVSIPELGISARDKIDELVTAEEEDDSSRDRDTDTESINLVLKIPSNAASGDYDVVTEVSYNRGKSVVKKIEVITVKGVSAEEAPGVEAIISIDTTTQNINKGEGAVYKVMFANLGKDTKTYSLEVAGVETWATSRTDPSFITVRPGETQDMFVYVSAKDDAGLGKHVFTIKIKSNNVVIKEINAEANVVGEAPSVTGAASWDQVRRGLEIGFAVLLIILVVLGIILAITKLRGPRGGEEEPGTAEGQSYYYYPRY